MLAFFGVFSCAFHLLVDSRHDVAGLVDRFKPEVHFPASVVLVGEVDQYARARICVANIEDHVGIMQYSGGFMHMYICTYKESTLTIQSCLWGVQDVDKASAFRSLFEWFEMLDPHGVVVRGSLRGDDWVECGKQGAVSQP